MSRARLAAGGSTANSDAVSQGPTRLVGDYGDEKFEGIAEGRTGDPKLTVTFDFESVTLDEDEAALEDLMNFVEKCEALYLFWLSVGIDATGEEWGFA